VLFGRRRGSPEDSPRSASTRRRRAPCGGRGSGMAAQWTGQRARAVETSPANYSNRSWPHKSPIQRPGEAKGWTVFHLPSTPRVLLRRSSSLSDAPGSAGSRSARSRTIPAGRRAIGVLRGAAAALPGLCRPACACVARDARARRRRRSGSGRRSSTRSPD